MRSVRSSRRSSPNSTSASTSSRCWASAAVWERSVIVFLARFSYDILPANRHRALELIHREVEAARADGLSARLLVPLTRGQGGAALQFEVELTTLDQLDQFRHRGVGSAQDTEGWMHSFSDVLTSPPLVEILRVEN